MFLSEGCFLLGFEMVPLESVVCLLGMRKSGKQSKWTLALGIIGGNWSCSLVGGGRVELVVTVSISTCLFKLPLGYPPVMAV